MRESVGLTGARSGWIAVPVEPRESSAYPVSTMARKSATTKATGGGGYTFADNVAAGFLVNVLQGSTPFDHSFGPPREIHFETRDSGHILDDLLVVLGASDSGTRAAISVKSGRELTAAGFSEEFAEDAWEEWHRPGFDINADTPHARRRRRR